MSFRILLSLASVLAATASASADTRTFGKPLEGLPAAKLVDLLARPAAGQKVRLEGTIEKVCQNKGCWITFKQGDQRVHVTFEGYSFFLPPNSASRPVVLEGKVLVKPPKADEVAHLKAEGAGAAAAEQVSIEASGVEIR